MNNKLKLVVAFVFCAALVHLLLSDCSLSADYSIWNPSFFAAPSSANLTEDPIAVVLHSTLSISADNASVSNFSLGNSTDDDVMHEQEKSLPLCPETPPGLVGPIKVWLDAPSFEQLEQLYPNLETGGHGFPEDCLARHRVAVIVPYRDREAHLRMLLHNLHSLLSKQQLDYSIVVVEQRANETFNRAKLMNAGFSEAMKLYDWQCFIFHDVDLLPEDDRNLYSCPDQPRHMSVAVDKFKYRLPYGSIFGGISALTKVQLEKINGFSNDYWGWGGEDDDLSTRVALAGYKISRYPANIARYKMIKHASEKENPVNKCRYKLMDKTKHRWRTDGLSSLSYELIGLKLYRLYTHVLVNLKESESRSSLRRTFPSC